MAAARVEGRQHSVALPFAIDALAIVGGCHSGRVAGQGAIVEAGEALVEVIPARGVSVLGASRQAPREACMHAGESMVEGLDGWRG